MEIGSGFSDRNHIARAQLHEETILAVIVYAWELVSLRHFLYRSKEGGEGKSKQKPRTNHRLGIWQWGIAVHSVFKAVVKKDCMAGSGIRVWGGSLAVNVVVLDGIRHSISLCLGP
jgi:hypothetical protein